MLDQILIKNKTKSQVQIQKQIQTQIKYKSNTNEIQIQIQTQIQPNKDQQRGLVTGDCVMLISSSCIEFWWISGNLDSYVLFLEILWNEFANSKCFSQKNSGKRLLLFFSNIKSASVISYKCQVKHCDCKRDLWFTLLHVAVRCMLWSIFCPEFTVVKFPAHKID